MSRLVTGLLPFTALALTLAGPSAPLRAGPADDLLPLRVKPLAERAIGIRPWELVSSSPFGGSRMGGTDQRGFAFSPDGKNLATEDAGGWQLELWDTDTGRSLGRFGRINHPAAIAFSPDGKTLVAAEGATHEVCAVSLWDVGRRTLVRELDEGVNFVPFTAVAFAPDGKTLALGGGVGRRVRAPAIHLWDAAGGDELRHFEDPAWSAAAARQPTATRMFGGLAFSPDGRSLAVAASSRLMLWEVATGKERCLLGLLPAVYHAREGLGDPASALAFAPDGRTLAVACADGAVRVWDLEAGTERPPLAGHQGRVRALAFAPDGKTLVSLGWDNKLLTWPAPAPGRDRRPRQGPLSDKEAEGLWDALLEGDALAVYGAARALAAAPDQALPLLRRHLRPVAPVDAQRLTQLVAELKNEDFNTRKRAAGELRRLGDLAIPALRQAGEKQYDEVLRRMLQQMESEYPTAEQVRALRGVEMLERMRTDEGRGLLTDLARGAPESALTGQARAALARLGQAAEPAGGDGKLEALWADLGGDDARRAYRAVVALAGRPDEAVPFLREQLRPFAAADAPDDDPERVARLIADLEGDEFAVREKASRELARLGKRAEPALRKALAGATGPELKRRLEQLLAQPEQPRLSPEQMQAGRALEALERIGNADARRALEGLSKEARNRWLKQAVAESLQRLDR
jgi:sugar lactone lactonase YvrE